MSKDQLDTVILNKENKTIKKYILNFKNPFNIYCKKYINMKINESNTEVSFIYNDLIETDKNLKSFGLFPYYNNIIYFLMMKEIKCIIHFNINNNQNKKLKFYNGSKYFILEDKIYEGNISNFQKLRIGLQDIDKNTIITYNNIEIIFDMNIMIDKIHVNHIQNKNQSYKINNNSSIDFTDIQINDLYEKNIFTKEMGGELIIKNLGKTTIYNPKIIVNFEDVNNNDHYYSDIDYIINKYTNDNFSTIDNINILFYIINSKIQHESFLINDSILFDIILDYNQLTTFGFGLCSNISSYFCRVVKRYFNTKNINSDAYFWATNGHWANILNYNNKDFFYDLDNCLFFYDQKGEILSHEQMYTYCVNNNTKLLENEETSDVETRNTDKNANMPIKKYIEIIKTKSNYLEGKPIKVEKKNILQLLENTKSNKIILRPDESFIFNSKEKYNFNLKPLNYKNLKNDISIMVIDYKPNINVDFLKLEGVSFKNVYIKDSQIYRQNIKDNSFIEISTKTKYFILNTTFLIETVKKNKLKLNISKDKINWIEVIIHTNTLTDLCDILSTDSHAIQVLYGTGNEKLFYKNTYDNTYQWHIRIYLENFSIKNIKLNTICLFNIDSQLLLKKGINSIEYLDENVGARDIEVKYNWQEYKIFKNNIYNIVNLTFPDNNKKIYNSDILFKWDTIIDCDEYNFIISKFQDFRYQFRRCGNIYTNKNEYRMKKSCFFNNITYYWKVRSIKNKILGKFSKIYKFTFYDTRVQTVDSFVKGID